MESSRIQRQYQVVRPLGTGGFGTVVLAMDTRDNKEVVIKTFRLDEVHNWTFTPNGRIPTEIHLLAQLNHPNLVPLLHTFTSTDNYHIMMPYTGGINVMDYLTTVRNPGIRWIAREMAKGIGHLHDCGVVHLDIKPLNAIVSENPRQVQIIDLGLSTLYNKGRKDILVNGGTRGYRCPEYLIKKIEGPEADVYSYGVTILKMIFGRTEIPEDIRASIHKLYNFMKAKNVLDADQRYDVRNLLLRTIFRKNSESRLTMAQVLSSGWIRQRGK